MDLSMLRLKVTQVSKKNHPCSPLCYAYTISRRFLREIERTNVSNYKKMLMTG